MIKNYVIRRVLEIKLYRQFTPNIIFDDIFKHCELPNANGQQKQDVRKIAVGIPENLKSFGLIKNFELTKKGDAFYAVSITRKKSRVRSANFGWGIRH